MSEHRSETRLATAGPAKIFVAGDHPAIACEICNISIAGACLQIDSGVSLPDVFNVAPDDGEDVTYPCRVLWRKDNRVGVKFE